MKALENALMGCGGFEAMCVQTNYVSRTTGSKEIRTIKIVSTSTPASIKKILIVIDIETVSPDTVVVTGVMAATVTTTGTVHAHMFNMGAGKCGSVGVHRWLERRRMDVRR